MKTKKRWIALAVLVWIAAIVGAIELTISIAHQDKKESAKVSAAKVSGGQPVANVAGAAMAWAYNSQPGAKIQQLLGCTEHGSDYQCVAVVNSSGLKCAGIAFNLTAAGKLKFDTAARLKDSVCGL